MIEDVKKRYIDVPGNSPVTEEDFSLLEKKYELSSFLPLRGKWSIEFVKDDQMQDGFIPN